MSGRVASVAVDAGQTETRARQAQQGGAGAARTGRAQGVEHLARPNGPTRAANAISDAIEGLQLARVDRVSVGLSGYPSDVSLVREMSHALMQATGANEVLVASDAATSYVGALAEEPGVVLAVGTGGVVVAADGLGRYLVAGGSGYLLGDAFSGFAVGQAGLRAVIASHQTGEPENALDRLARKRFGDPASLPDRIYGAQSPVAEVAAFAPDVGEAARARDPVALAIWASNVSAAAATLLQSVDRFFRSTDRIKVSWSGGLCNVEDLFLGPLRDAASAINPALRFQAPIGTALDGAANLLDGAEPRAFPGLVNRDVRT